MNTQANKPLHLPLLSGSMAALLLSGIAIASLAISAQGFDGVFVPAKPPEAVAASAGAAPGANRCAECGVIESTREIEGPDAMIRVHTSGQTIVGGEIAGRPARNWEITIRLQDGSMRVITDASPAMWKSGERVKIIAGVN